MFSKTLIVFLIASQFCSHVCDSVFLNEWSVKIEGGQEAADLFALQNGFINFGEIIPGSGEFHMKYPRRPKRSENRDKLVESKLMGNILVASAEQLVEHIRVKRDQESLVDSPYDPVWSKMWYLHSGDELDMTVQEAWFDGFSGKGVNVAVLDDGIEKDHPDLIKNYDPNSSTDINDNDSDPHPRYDKLDTNRHGTRCAGQIAAASNNSLCAVGIAFNAKIGGIRLLDGHINDAVEARALSFNQNHIDIFSSSWGPADDGATVEGPGRLTSQAIQRGVNEGRKGKGNIFVWASGNGGRYKDNCNCDGYSVSIHTITVGSATETGAVPWYSEACSSTLATTFSSGSKSERSIVTTDLRHSCTANHTGTSASAPMAAGIIALTLEANPSLTWRDVQYIIVKTARPTNLKASDWKTNGWGRSVSHLFGFGLMDTHAMVKMAKTWKNVPPQAKCVVSSPYYYKEIAPSSSIILHLEVLSCPGVSVLEHVVSPLFLSTSRKRGDFRIYLTSPSGTRSTLLDSRPHDFSYAGFVNWPFMTVHSWGESPIGTWKLEIHNDATSKWIVNAKLFKWSLEFYGTSFDPNSPTPKPGGASHASATTIQKDQSSIYQLISEMFSVHERPSKNNDASVASPTSGCISKSGICTRDAAECQTFSSRAMSSYMCKCIPYCTNVDHAAQSPGLYSLICPLDPDEGGADVSFNNGSELPVFCKFLSLSSQDDNEFLN